MDERDEDNFTASHARLENASTQRVRDTILSIDALLADPAASLRPWSTAIRSDAGGDVVSGGHHRRNAAGPNRAAFGLEEIAAEWLDVGESIPGLVVVGVACTGAPGGDGSGVVGEGLDEELDEEVLAEDYGEGLAGNLGAIALLDSAGGECDDDREWGHGGGWGSDAHEWRWQRASNSNDTDVLGDQLPLSDGFFVKSEPTAAAWEKSSQWTANPTLQSPLRAASPLQALAAAKARTPSPAVSPPGLQGLQIHGRGQSRSSPVSPATATIFRVRALFSPLSIGAKAPRVSNAHVVGAPRALAQGAQGAQRSPPPQTLGAVSLSITGTALRR